MVEAVKVRRQRRAITQAGSQPAASTSNAAALMDEPAITVSVENALAQLMASRMEKVRRGDYSILGRIGRMETSRGVIQFPHNSGPVIGFVVERDGKGEVVRVSESELVIVNAWQGLPNVRVNTEEPCQACLTDCDICATSGRKTCERCGGARKINGPSEPCDADGCTKENGRYNPDCFKCRGAGMIIPLVSCPGCEGEGTQVCPQCRGNKKYATGNKSGATDWRAPSCEVCNGTRFAGEDVEQLEADFTNWQGSAGWRALGPITRFIVESVGGAGTPPRMFDVDQDTGGNYMTLVLDLQQNACLTGGILKSTARR